MKKGLEIFLVPSLILFFGDVLIDIIWSIIYPGLDSISLESLDKKLIIFALMIFVYKLVKEFKYKPI